MRAMIVVVVGFLTFREHGLIKERWLSVGTMVLMTS